MQAPRDPIAEPLIVMNTDGAPRVYCPVHRRSLMRLRGSGVYLCPRQPELAPEDQCRYRISGQVAWDAKQSAAEQYYEQHAHEHEQTPRAAGKMEPEGYGLSPEVRAIFAEVLEPFAQSPATEPSLPD